MSKSEKVDEFNEQTNFFSGISSKFFQALKNFFKNFSKKSNNILPPAEDYKSVMRRISTEEIENKYTNDKEYVWYACYGSNINFNRFMYYIYGDVNGNYSDVDGCEDKSSPIDEKPFIFDCPLYFAGHSHRWNSGMAFLDYENEGKSYGKIYKITLGQFKGVLKQEQKCELYDAIIHVGDLEGIPVLSFTASHKLDNITNPSPKYCDVIKSGILDLYKDATSQQIDEYFKTGNILNA